MKKIIGWILLIIVATGAFLIVKEKNKIYDMESLNSEIEIKIKYKGLKDAIDFTMNENNIFVAFSNKVLCIPNDEEPYTLIEDESLNISEIEINGDKLFLVNENKIISVDITNGELEECLVNLPNIGDYKNVILKSYKDYLFLSLGAATNSGIVGSDNKWTAENQIGHDISPYDIKLNKSENGAFLPLGTSSEDNEVIKGEKLGTSSIVIYNTKSKNFETYAFGIRNVAGMDIAEDGRIFATVGGYENRGLRPVENDRDYIYEIKKGYWYGFPDYSGGDPLNSPRFQGDSAILNTPLIKNYPMTPPAPLYQHNKVSSLKWIVVDNKGEVNNSNNMCLYFYDSKNNSILYSTVKGVPKELVNLKDRCFVSSMKILNDKFYILDSKSGVLFTIASKK